MCGGGSENIYVTKQKGDCEQRKQNIGLVSNAPNLQNWSTWTFTKGCE